MKFDSVLLPHLPRNLTEAKVRSLLDVRFAHTPQAIDDIVDNCGLEFARAFVFWLVKTPEGKSWLCRSYNSYVDQHGQFFRYAESDNRIHVANYLTI